MKTIPFTLISILLFFSSSPAQETQGFQNDLNAGFTLTTGNSETTSLNLGAESKRINQKQELLFSASYEYGQTTDTNAQGVETETTNLDRAKGEAQSNWLFSETMYSFYNLSAEKDEKNKVDYRVITGPGLGYYFLRNDDYLLSTESSLVYVVEELQKNKDDYAALRFAQKFERRFQNGARLWQSLEIISQLSETEDYLLNIEMGAEAKLNDTLALRIVLKNKYNNAPEPNVENNDLTLISGISIRI